MALSLMNLVSYSEIKIPKSGAKPATSASSEEGLGKTIVDSIREAFAGVMGDQVDGIDMDMPKTPDRLMAEIELMLKEGEIKPEQAQSLVAIMNQMPEGAKISLKDLMAQLNTGDEDPLESRVPTEVKGEHDPASKFRGPIENNLQRPDARVLVTEERSEPLARFNLKRPESGLKTGQDGSVSLTQRVHDVRAEGLSKVDTTRLADAKQSGQGISELKVKISPEGKAEAKLDPALGKKVAQIIEGKGQSVAGQAASASVSAATGPAGMEGTTGQRPMAEWSPIQVKTSSPGWGRELASALGERLQMQVNQNVKEASVRLDPPDLGRIDLSIRSDGDRLTLTMNSSNAQVRDLLNQHIDRLRNDLAGTNSQSIDVSVGDGRQQGGDNGKNMGGNGDSVMANVAGNAGEEDSSSNTSDQKNWLDTTV